MNFDEIRQELEAKDYGEVTEQDVISYVYIQKYLISLCKQNNNMVTIIIRYTNVLLRYA